MRTVRSGAGEAAAGADAGAAAGASLAGAQAELTRPRTSTSPRRTDRMSHLLLCHAPRSQVLRGQPRIVVRRGGIEALDAYAPRRGAQRMEKGIAPERQGYVHDHPVAGEEQQVARR